MPKAKKSESRKSESKNSANKNSAKKSGGKSKKNDMGAKLSKAFRNFGPVREMMNSSLGREILADVIIAAAGAAAVALTKSRGKKAGTVADAGAVGANAARDAVQTAAGAVAGVVSDAARQFLPASLLTGEPPPRSAPARSSPVRKARSAPKKRKAAPRKTATASAPPTPKPSEA